MLNITRFMDVSEFVEDSLCLHNIIHFLFLLCEHIRIYICSSPLNTWLTKITFLLFTHGMFTEDILHYSIT